MFRHGVPLLAALLLASGLSPLPGLLPASGRAQAAQEIHANWGAYSPQKTPATGRNALYAQEIPADCDTHSSQEILATELTAYQTQEIPISGQDAENPAATQDVPAVSGNHDRHRSERFSASNSHPQSAQSALGDNRQAADKPTDKQQTDNELTILCEWRAGTPVSAAAVELFGEERCFTVAEIDDRLFSRIYGKSYKEVCPVPRAELRYLRVLHRDLEGRIVPGEMICNRAIAGDLVDIFRTLYKAGYPIERMVLIDEYDADDTRSMEANNSSSFNFRTVAGSAALSKHSRGMAVDINPLYNPCVSRRSGRTVVEPGAGRPYADRSRKFPCKIDHEDLCYREFTRRGFTWGGNWRSLKDYQHFEKKE